MKEFKNIEDRFIENLSDFNFCNRSEAIANFTSFWNDIGSYGKHVKKRIRNEDIWDRVFYNSQKSWAVVIGENGKILTSYKIRDDIIKTLEKHKELFASKYEKKVVSYEFSKEVREIYERLTRV